MELTELDKRVERLCKIIEMTLPLMLEEASSNGEDYDDMNRILSERIQNTIRQEFPRVKQ